MAYIQREGLRQRRLERDGAALTPSVHDEIILLANVMFLVLLILLFAFGLSLRQVVDVVGKYSSLLNDNRG